MTRKPPAFDPPVLPTTAPQRPGYTTQQRSYRLITPLFGGGVEPQRPDPVTVVRATSIRGQLRFWWRATRGGQYATVEQLKEAEDALWGAASGDGGGGPSLVEVVVKDGAKGASDVPFVVEGTRQRPKLKKRFGSSVPEYAAFPLQPPQKEQVPEIEITPVWLNVTFTLVITYPESQRADVEAALWAWETFGGIGGRTRRGFGALELLQVDGIAPDDRPQARREDVVRWLHQRLESYTTGAILTKEWPQVATDSMVVITQPHSSPLECWKFLIEQLRKFRNRQINGWPEADSVRRIAGQTYKSKSATPPGRNTFPRAVFGLPIIFHFTGRDALPDATLQGVDHDRLASPLILRPLACANGHYVGLALVLHALRTPPDGIKIKGYAPSDPLTIKLNDQEAAKILSLSGKTDVLRAFLDYLEGAAK
jgi:CRISPR-associated protein Cmr1